MTERDQLESELRIALRVYRNNPTGANNAAVHAICDRMMELISTGQQKENPR
jgi:hypothetical protein